MLLYKQCNICNLQLTKTVIVIKPGRSDIVIIDSMNDTKNPINDAIPSPISNP